GVGIYLCLIAIPGGLGLVDTTAVEFRLDEFGLSGRGALWQDALEMLYQNPALGGGPMTFAGLHHRLGSHPHSSVIQLASEWGLVAAILVILLVARGVWIFGRACRAPGAGFFQL